VVAVGVQRDFDEGHHPEMGSWPGRSRSGRRRRGAGAALPVICFLSLTDQGGFALRPICLEWGFCCCLFSSREPLWATCPAALRLGYSLGETAPAVSLRLGKCLLGYTEDSVSSRDRTLCPPFSIQLVKIF
jgi:hypothetical protein